LENNSRYEPLKLLAAVVVGLLIAVLFMALFYVYSVRFGGPQNWPGEGADAEQAASLEPDTRPEAVQTLDADLTRIGEGLKAKLGIAVVDLQTGDQADFNGEALMPQQSVSKLWVALTALDQSDKGELNLGTTATAKREDLTLFHQPIRKQVLANGSFTTSYSDFMRRALVGSDNTANDMLLKRIGGPEAVRAMLTDKGLENIRFGPGETIMQSQLAGLEWDPSFALGKTFFEVRKTVPHEKRRQVFDAYVADPVDGATTIAIADALAKLAKGQLLLERSTRIFLEMLRDAKSGPNRLKGGLPEGWQIAHKTGTGQVLDIVPPGVIGEQTGYNDVGILTAPDGSRYAVAVMIGHTKTPVGQRMEMMHSVVRAIVDYHSRKKGLEVPQGEAENASSGEVEQGSGLDGGSLEDAGLDEAAPGAEAMSENMGEGELMQSDGRAVTDPSATGSDYRPTQTPAEQGAATIGGTGAMGDATRGSDDSSISERYRVRDRSGADFTAPTSSPLPTAASTGPS
jgi:beta-lactamase class A